MKHIYFIVLLFSCMTIRAQQVEYAAADSIRIEQILKQAQKEKPENAMLYFGKQFLGVPYVGHTLEVGDKEHLIINTRELDCTTFVENVLALYLCHQSKSTSFRSFCNNLRNIRYRGGKLTDYTSRLHYFTWWGEDNEQMGLVKAIDMGKFPFTATQRLNINYMSVHPTLYKHLKANPQFVKVIAAQEKASNGKTYRYIPKSLLNRSESELSCIHTGDIVSLITKKAGLDTSHVGIAVWQNGKLHLMHASSLNMKVILAPSTFYDYGQRQTSMLGIRVYRPIANQPQ
ncbi:MAG: DUF1460 domain-containing protein [Bacteroidaceae bacterium]|nr:DUF1460 domain-containing protein [Bacteroidaceae bacterium]